MYPLLESSIAVLHSPITDHCGRTDYKKKISNTGDEMFTFLLNNSVRKNTSGRGSETFTYCHAKFYFISSVIMYISFGILLNFWSEIYVPPPRKKVVILRL